MHEKLSTSWGGEDHHRNRNWWTSLVMVSPVSSWLIPCTFYESYVYIYIYIYTYIYIYIHALWLIYQLCYIYIYVIYMWYIYICVYIHTLYTDEFPAIGCSDCVFPGWRRWPPRPPRACRWQRMWPRPQERPASSDSLWILVYNHWLLTLLSWKNMI